MRKLSLALTFALVVGGATVTAQEQLAANTSPSNDAPNMGRAPKEINGVGRLDLRVYDEDGNPIPNAYAELESRRTDGFFCEAFGSTDRRGVFAMPPLHMGDLTLKIKAKGYKNASIKVDRNSLDQPVVVRLVKK